MTAPVSNLVDANPGEFFPPAGELVELSLLLPGWQAQELETAAHNRGLTTAQMLRVLIRDYCAGRQQPPVWRRLPGREFST